MGCSRTRSTRRIAPSRPRPTESGRDTSTSSVFGSAWNAKEAAVDANVAASEADWAEADAEDAIAFALSAIVEAEYATLDAMLAREDAAKLAGSSS
jgi:hypothetical protein